SRPRLPTDEKVVYTPKFLTPDELIETVEAIRVASTPGAAAPGAAKPMGGIGRMNMNPGAGISGTSPHEEDEQFDMFPLRDTGNVLIVGRHAGIEKAMELIRFVDVDTPKPIRETIVLKYRDPNDVI